MRSVLLPTRLAALLLGALPLATLSSSARADNGPGAAVLDSRAAVTAGSAFNPQVSLILTGHYRHDNEGGEGPERLEEAAGILHGVHFHEHGHGSGNGFALGESELVLSATVDPYFDARFIAAFDGHGETELEEAWLQTRMLPYGLKLTAGKFFSGIGYQNAQHPHAWDFDDQALPYTALLGDHGLNDTGVQLTWLAPMPFYLLLGAEALQGNDQERFGTLVEEDDALGVITPASGALPEHKDGPRLVTAFAKVAPELGDDHALQLGLSFARASQYQQLQDEDEAAGSGDEFFLDGEQTLYGADLVYKFDGKGEKGAGDLKLAAEYLRLETELDVTADGGAAPLATGDRAAGEQDGWYVSATWGVAPRWTLGLRLDATGATNRLTAAGATTDLEDTMRSTVAIAWKPSEFSRLRLQGSRADIGNEDGSRTELDQVMLTYTLSLGAHGAHAF